MQNNLLQFVRQTIERGGASYCIHTGQMNPSKGYMVSLEDYELKHNTEDLTYDEIASDIRHYAAQVNYAYLYQNYPPEQVYLGTWFNDEILHCDVSIHINDLDDALKLGRDNKQIAIYDCANQTDIVL